MKQSRQTSLAEKILTSKNCFENAIRDQKNSFPQHKFFAITFLTLSKMRHE